jgi:NAD(P)-dependent dehydrogenase (short-subunit alcohol dehydrogenase family)
VVELKDSMNAQGKVVFVTGAASGIGRATAHRFSKMGAKVMLTDINEEGGEAVARAINQAGGEAQFLRVDVSDAAAVENAVEQTVTRFGGLDYAANIAGVPQMGGGLFCDPKEYVRCIDVNLYGTIHSVRAEASAMKRLGIRGAIVNCSSTAGVLGSADIPYYSATKHAIVGFTKSAAIALAPSGIRVNVIAPGFTRTGMTEGFFGDALETVGKAMTFFDRIGEPEEIANAVVWLCSPESSFVTGTFMAVDGGFLAGPRPWAPE